MLSISVIRKSIPVLLESEGGNTAEFSIKEMTGAQRDDFLAVTNKKLRLDPNGDVVGVNEYKGMYSTLLSFCMYDPDGKLVPEATIQSWPDSAQKQLWEAASTLNGLKQADGKDEDEPKN